MIKRISTLETCVTVRVEKEEGKFIVGTNYDFRNPIHVLKHIDEFGAEEMSEIIQAFEGINFEYGKKEATHFNTSEECENYINKLENSIDHHTIYIDNYKQMQDAEKWNEVLENEINFVEKHGYSPEVIKKEGVRNIINQVYGILGGIEVRNDKVVISHLINWIKKMGYEKTIVDKETQTFCYETKIMVDNYGQYFESCFSFQKKKDGSYDVKFLYAFPSINSSEEGHIINRNHHELELNRGFYLYN